MKLKRETFFIQILCCCKRAVLSASNNFKAFSHLENCVLVAHPDLLASFNAFEKRTLAVCSANALSKVKGGKTKLTDFALANLAIVAKLNNVMTITKTKDWNIKI